MPLAVSPDLDPEARRQVVLTICDEKGWFDYESANPAGYVDERGVRHAGLSYSVVLFDGRTPLCLDAELVDGFVYREAIERDDVAAIAWRDDM